MTQGSSSDKEIAANRQDWIVLGSRQHGISFGPMTKPEAEVFAAERPGMIALSWDGACSQIETCVAYGLPYKPRLVALKAEVQS